ncbi:MAG: hypothetical protein KIT84_05555 [Labilithrix sp.]|nr:hypothetical protein [Labilithrix sp.]MCW5810454.1 hypothetical protein [Labilithrix sp.]
MARIRALAVVVAAAGALAVFACDDVVIDRPCTNIPPNGCPLANGVSCADPRCEAIYLCRRGNVWERGETCPNFDPDAGARVVPDAGDDAGLVENPNAPPGAYGGPGCGVLQEPDCTVGLGLTCTNGCCGCEDFFVCSDGAWDLWAICADGGFTKL